MTNTCRQQLEEYLGEELVYWEEEGNIFRGITKDGIRLSFSLDGLYDELIFERVKKRIEHLRKLNEVSSRKN